MDTDDVAAPTGIDEIKRKMHLTGTVIKTTLAGAIVDIGLNIPGVVHISQLQKEPVNRVEDVLQPGQKVDVWVRRVYPPKNRIELTMIKPLDLEWRDIKKDMVLKGKVVRIEKFGVFVEIGAERPGLVHVSELTHDYIRTPSEFVKEGDEVEVKVLGVNRQKKQIKLSMKALEERQTKPPKPNPPKETEPQDKEKEGPVPTAMEIAMREAMQRSRSQEPEELPTKRKGPRLNREMENILSRTLERKVRTGAKD